MTALAQRSRTYWLLVGGSAFLLAIGLANFSLDRWQTARSRQEGLLSVPPLGALKVVACGYRNLLADICYLRFTTYWGYWLTHGRKFHNLFPLLELVVELDPDFRPAYEVGALALADAGKPFAAADLLAKGAQRSPADYWYPYQAGLMFFLYSNNYLLAAKYFERAARLPTAPPEAGFFAARMYLEGGKRDLAIATWANIHTRTTDKNVREVASRALGRLGIDPDRPGGNSR
ncbi:MAG: hypothetical protein HY692_00990 [Cyanobacteria bacterium NC_groundwater_1444_Ag_S-0.65um_54_12]|nr:hypothetical protein [Cyanobacteria bacterium NC_groundwater_1444_Ag_S-0.65um_54_12]